MDAGRQGQQGLPQGVQPPDMDQLVLQHVGHPLLLPPGGGQQDHGPQQAVGHRRVHPVRLPQGDGPPQLPFSQPVQQVLVLHRQGGPEFFPTAEVRNQEERSAEHSPGQPYHPPDVRRRPALQSRRRAGGSSGAGGKGCCGKDRSFCRGGHGGSRRQRLRPLRQGIYAGGGGDGEGDQQPRRRHRPQGQKGSLGQPVQRQRAQYDHRQDQYAPGKAHVR